MIFGHAYQMILEEKEVVVLQIQMFLNFLFIFILKEANWFLILLDKFKFILFFRNYVAPLKSHSICKVYLDGHNIFIEIPS